MLVASPNTHSLWISKGIPHFRLRLPWISVVYNLLATKAPYITSLCYIGHYDFLLASGLVHHYRNLYTSRITLQIHYITFRVITIHSATTWVHYIYIQCNFTVLQASIYYVSQGNQFTNSAVLSTSYQCNQCKLTSTYIHYCITNQFCI